MQKKISFNTVKNCEKVEIVYVTTSSYYYYLTRGGVQETTFQAKEKDSKKIRGQRPAFRGQTLSRPRPRTEDSIFLIMVGKFFFFNTKVFAIIAFR